MLMWKHLKRLALLASTILGSGATSGCADEPRIMPGVQESGYVMPFPLQQGGEQIDLLVRVRDDERPHQFTLILVMRHDWPEEKKDALSRIYRGFAIGDPAPTPNPIRLRIRIDAVDEKNNFHDERIISDTKPQYTEQAENGAAAWRGQMLYARKFTPGIYRVRVDNLAPVPQIDFQTLFGFERFSRKV